MHMLIEKFFTRNSMRAVLRQEFIAIDEVNARWSRARCGNLMDDVVDARISPDPEGVEVPSHLKAQSRRVEVPQPPEVVSFAKFQLGKAIIDFSRLLITGQSVGGISCRVRLHSRPIK